MRIEPEAGTTHIDDLLKDLPATTAQELKRFLQAVICALGSDLLSVVLFGSAAENRIRPTSDVNLVMVLRAFAQEKIDQIRDPLRRARASIGLAVMLILEQELKAASSAFAVKFGDMIRRHKVLFGADPFAGISIQREDHLAELRRVLLNLVLRTREGYVERSLREEQAATAVAELAGPLRSCAATLCELEGAPAASPKQALLDFAASLSGDGWRDALENLSIAREQRRLPAGVAVPTYLKLLELARQMYDRAAGLT